MDKWDTSHRESRSGSTGPQQTLRSPRGVEDPMEFHSLIHRQDEDEMICLSNTHPLLIHWEDHRPLTCKRTL